MLEWLIFYIAGSWHRNKKSLVVRCYVFLFLNFSFEMIFQIATWSKHQEKINSLRLLGEHILSSDIKGNIYMWSFKGDGLNLEPVSHIKLEKKFTPTCIVHPDTYLNKVLKNCFNILINDCFQAIEDKLQVCNADWFCCFLLLYVIEAAK